MLFWESATRNKREDFLCSVSDAEYQRLLFEEFGLEQKYDATYES